MECWILYDPSDLERNRFFAQRLRDSGAALGMDTRIVTSDSLPEHTPDAVVSRTRDWTLSEALESRGARVFNPSSVSRVCNDKLATYRLARCLGIPFLDVSVPGEDPPAGPPWVVKSRHGHGGGQVFMARDRAELDSLCERLGDSAIIQSCAPVLGRDMRAYVLDGEVLACVMRSSDTDFRANRGLGGRAELCEPPDGCLDILRGIVGELEPALAGIDFVFGENGKAFLNEVEDVVGTRMLYELTDLDPAALLMGCVHSKMSL